MASVTLWFLLIRTTEKQMVYAEKQTFGGVYRVLPRAFWQKDSEEHKNNYQHSVCYGGCTMWTIANFRLDANFLLGVT